MGMMEIPTGEKELLAFALNLVEQCRVSASMREAYYRVLAAVYETGRYDGTKSLINTLPNHIGRLAGMLYSPVQLKFAVDFLNIYPAVEILRAKQAAKLLGKDWSRPDENGDTLWGRGVVDALKYGATFLKQWTELDWDKPVYQKKLVMPWQIGVVNESENDINKQEAICETSTLTMPEVWKRIWYLPEARKMYERIETHAGLTPTTQAPDTFFHQILSTSQLQTQGTGGPVVAGGIVQINQNPNYAMMGPVISAPAVKFHELWVKGEDDYVTLQIIEPDILITKYKHANLLGIRRKQPYRIIQPNETSNWIWGRSELVDLVEPQVLLSVWADDMKRLYGLQVDKIIAFSGEGNITDEMYGQFRGTGYINLGQGATVTDLTPKIPPEALPLMQWLQSVINLLAGFPPVMQGQGDTGVRAGVQLDTLMKTASPTQRDRALLVERQLASAGQLSLDVMRAKDPKFYWTDGSSPDAAEASKFLLADLPDDYQVGVDSHSSSPIFSDENMQLIFQARKIGDVDGEYMLDNLPFPNKEQAKAALKQKQQNALQQEQQIEGQVAHLPPQDQAKVITAKLRKSG